MEKSVKKFEDEAKNATNKLKDLEEKLKKQDNLVGENLSSSPPHPLNVELVLTRIINSL